MNALKKREPPMSDTLIASAVARLRAVPGFANTAQSHREALARQAIEDEGSDPSDPLLVALVLERMGDDGHTLPPRPDRVSWLYQVKTATGWPDRYVSELMDMSRATVQAYIGSRIPETITHAQARALVNAMRRQVTALERLAGEMEKHL